MSHSYEANKKEHDKINAAITQLNFDISIYSARPDNYSDDTMERAIHDLKIQYDNHLKCFRERRIIVARMMEEEGRLTPSQ